MDKHVIITIGRQYGSGGKEVGQQLAKELGVPCYDDELLAEAAKNSGICEEMFKSHDEKPTSSFLYSLVIGSYASGNTPINHKLFLAQFDTIKELAKKGSCVIIGRCADYALEDNPYVINVFLHGNIERRIQRAIKNYDIDPAKAKDTVIKTDKKRASYYNFYTGKKWGDSASYDLSIDSSRTGVAEAVELIKAFVEIREKRIAMNK